jgi:hypothetical protein
MTVTSDVYMFANFGQSGSYSGPLYDIDTDLELFEVSGTSGDIICFKTGVGNPNIREPRVTSF